MPITYPTTPPATPAPVSADFAQMAVVGANPNPYTGSEQVFAWSGQWWEVVVTYATRKKSSLAPVVAWAVGQNGIEGTFLYGDPANKVPRGVGTGAPLVNGASQGGYDLITDGWTHGIANILRCGDWLQLGTTDTSRLYMVMADVTSDGAGNATVTLWPALRSSPADNAAITLAPARGLFRLKSAAKWSIDKAGLYTYGFSAREAL